MRDYSLRGMLSEAREGTEKDFDASILRSEYKAPSGKPTMRAFNSGLREMLDAAVGSSYDGIPQRDIEERNQGKEKRGWGIKDMLRDAVEGSG